MISILAYAKINLSLSVLRRRQDGFHEIDSLIQTINLADEITLNRTGDALSVENDLGIPPQDDLVWRAARLVLDEKRVRYGMQITVHKRIPVGAGLGGGSSDAAAILWAVDRLTPPVLSSKRLLSLAGRIGSDVPLFLSGGLVHARGRGEKITPVLPSRREHFVLLVPPVHCNTARVYQEMQTRLSPDSKQPRESKLGENDLYEAAVFLYPELASYAQAIKGLGAEYAGMSGSGSTFFAAFSDTKLAANARKTMKVAFPRAQVYVVRGTITGFLAKGEE